MKDESFWKDRLFKKGRIDLIQINLGNRCNLKCSHCHIGASPDGKSNMDQPTAVQIINKLKDTDVYDIEFTGGEPELNPNLRLFIEKLIPYNKNITVRTNLTALDLPAYSFYLDLYAKYKVKIIASLPDLFPDTTDKQRGKGVFEKSIKVLNSLNTLGYGKNGLSLDLVYNPAGDYLPQEPHQLEDNYKKILRERYNISFNRLISMVNSPIKRFSESLKQRGRFEEYVALLKKNYNPETLNKIMCKSLITIDHGGYIYDCDFNLALHLKTKGCEDKKFWETDLSDFSPEINFGEHCYACTVNQGSSCHGALIEENKKSGGTMKERVKKYYGEELQKTGDLKTGACCSTTLIPDYIKDALALINEEIKMKYYGCGSPIPLCLTGLNILDAGCGTGRDAYVASRLAGEKGFVYGIDMTEKQLAIASKYIKEQTARFGYQKPNIEFILDNMENISKHIQKESIDLTISNCVINLSEDKEIVLREIFNALKWGGEFYFSDVYADRKSHEEIKNNPILFAECLGGALYHKDFIRIAKRAGFTDPRIVSKREISIDNTEIAALVGDIKFYSITYRLWKLKGLEDACEDYGHMATYKGGIPESPLKFELDSSHIFYLNKPERICGNTALMLSETRFSKYFYLTGNFKNHLGEFKECGTKDMPENTGKNSMAMRCC